MAKQIGEFELIDRYFRPLATHPGAFGLKDDAAIIDVPTSKQLVMSKDLLVADTHFFADDPPELIARKAIRTNISDLISKGATPLYFMLGLSFPTPPSSRFMAAFVGGLRADQDTYDISLLGGDTTRSRADFLISITMLGLVDKGRIITRLNAGIDDRIYVTGNLGDASVGLLMRTKPELGLKIDQAHKTALLDAYLLPQPPFGIQNTVTEFASASMDISDGLLADMTHLARASQLTAEINQDHIPLSNAVRAFIHQNSSLEDVVTKGGDDYQCLMTIPVEHENLFVEHCSRSDIKVTKIGKMSPMTKEPVILKKDGAVSPLKTDGFTHF